MVVNRSLIFPDYQCKNMQTCFFFLPVAFAIFPLANEQRKLRTISINGVNAHFGSLYRMFCVFKTFWDNPTISLFFNHKHSNEFPTILSNKFVCRMILKLSPHFMTYKILVTNLMLFCGTFFFLDVVGGRGWEFPARLEFALGLTNNVRRPSALCTNTRRPPSKVLELSWQASGGLWRYKLHSIPPPNQKTVLRNKRLLRHFGDTKGDKRVS